VRLLPVFSRRDSPHPCGPPRELRSAFGLTGRPRLDSPLVVRPPWLPAEIGGALADIGAPAYILDHNGVTRWMNARAIELFGDLRGVHFTASVAPEARATARVEFAKKMLGTARTSDFELVEVLRSGERVSVEIHSAAIEEGGRVVGIFGIIDVDRQGSGPRKPPPPDLTPRQYEVLRLLARGSSTAQIAESLSLSRETVRNHVRGLLSALRVNSRIEALIEGRRRGFID
jgi:DNA-binding CsgD family transcriptional regulator